LIVQEDARLTAIFDNASRLTYGASERDTDLIQAASGLPGIPVKNSA
jgi:hypothetical protein